MRRSSNPTNRTYRSLGALWILAASLFALAGVTSGCSGAVPHHLAAPPIAGTVHVDVIREGAWQPLAPTSWALESDCVLKVRDVPDGDVVRVRYTSEPGLRCTPNASPSVRIAGR